MNKDKKFSEVFHRIKKTGYVFSFLGVWKRVLFVCVGTWSLGGLVIELVKDHAELAVR